MKTLLTTLLIGLLAGPAAALCAGDSFLDDLTPAERSDIDAAVADTAYGSGLFWTATRGDRVIWLAGTMHLYDERHGPLLTELLPVIEAADIVYLEVTPEEEKLAQEALTRDPSRFFITEGPTLPEMLEEETWQSLADAASARGVPPILAAKMQPWYLALSLAMPPCAMAEIMSGQRGLDHMIGSVADGYDTPLAPLESWETLFRIMEESSPEEQLDSLRFALTPDAELRAMIVAALDLYFAGRIAEAWEVSRVAAYRNDLLTREETDEIFAENEEILLTGRNLNWMPVIRAAAEANDRILVAVGAAHLPGETGLLRLLEEDGWAIAPGL